MQQAVNEHHVISKRPERNSPLQGCLLLTFRMIYPASWLLSPYSGARIPAESSWHLLHKDCACQRHQGCLAALWVERAKPRNLRPPALMAPCLMPMAQEVACALAPSLLLPWVSGPPPALSSCKTPVQTSGSVKVIP